MMNQITSLSLHPAELHAVRQIVKDIANLLTIAAGHIELTMKASKEHPVNRVEELTASQEASDLAIKLARRLSYIIGPDGPGDDQR